MVTLTMRYALPELAPADQPVNIYGPDGRTFVEQVRHDVTNLHYDDLDKTDGFVLVVGCVQHDGMERHVATSFRTNLKGDPEGWAEAVAIAILTTSPEWRLVEGIRVSTP